MQPCVRQNEHIHFSILCCWSAICLFSYPPSFFSKNGHGWLLAIFELASTKEEEEEEEGSLCCVVMLVSVGGRVGIHFTEKREKCMLEVKFEKKGLFKRDFKQSTVKDLT